jgi:CO/xanthine dehydrogenase Mo-binding subunit
MMPAGSADVGDKLRGAVRYAGDFSAPSMVYVVPVLAPTSSAVVLGIDTTSAEHSGGVVRVITARDALGSNRYGPIVKSQPVLLAVGERVRYWGDTLALVAAESPSAAREAASKVRVAYRDLPGVFSAVEALEEGAPLLYEDQPGNLCAEDELVVGNPDEALAAADLIAECELEVPAQEHAFLEPEAAFVNFDEDGRVVLFSCTQDPHYFHREISQAVGVARADLRVVATTMGGAFGGKEEVTLQAQAVLAALLTRRPVKMVYSREESFRIHPKRHPLRMKARIGSDRNGRVTVMDVDFVGDAGAYMGKSPVVLSIVLHALSGPYYLPNLRFHGRMAYTNNIPNGACRGYGQPQACVLREVAVDRLAELAGMDPIETRRINALSEGQPAGTPWVTMDTPSTLERVLQEALAGAGREKMSTRPGVVCGRGVACAMPLFDTASLPAGDMMDSTVAVEVLRDGSVVIQSSGVDFGQGIRGMLATYAAESFGVDVTQVRVVLGDTDVCPNSGPTVASRQTCVSGGALLAAATKIRSAMCEAAAALLATEPEDILFEGGKVRSKKDADQAVPFEQLARRCWDEGVRLRAESDAPPQPALIGHTFVATVADVEVDTVTGETSVTHLSLAHDIGRAIDPQAARGQIIGGAIMNLGWVLVEGFEQRDGRLLTPSLGECLICTAADVPRVEVTFLECPYPPGPSGAKGVAEHGSMSTAPAILNAIHDACGVRLTQFPVTPERLLTAMSRMRTPLWHSEGTPPVSGGGEE